MVELISNGIQADHVDHDDDDDIARLMESCTSKCFIENQKSFQKFSCHFSLSPMVKKGV